MVEYVRTYYLLLLYAEYRTTHKTQNTHTKQHKTVNNNNTTQQGRGGRAGPQDYDDSEKEEGGGKCLVGGVGMSGHGTGGGHGKSIPPPPTLGASGKTICQEQKQEHGPEHDQQSRE